jgi:hypothetical protein
MYLVTTHDQNALQNARKGFTQCYEVQSGNVFVTTEEICYTVGLKIKQEIF